MCVKCTIKNAKCALYIYPVNWVPNDLFLANWVSGKKVAMLSKCTQVIADTIFTYPPGCLVKILFVGRIDR